MRGDSTSKTSDEYSQQSKHRIVFSRNNTYNSDYSLGYYENFLPPSNSNSQENNNNNNNSNNNNNNNYNNNYNNNNNENDFNDIESIQQYKSDNNDINNFLLLFKDSLMNNYIIFCISFSLNIAPVISTLIYAPAVIGDEIGALGNGCFYLSYAIFTLLFSKTSVHYFGCVKSFFLGQFGTLLYVLSFILFSKEYILQEYIYFSGTIIGGISQGLLWTAHSKYFNKSSQMMISSMNYNEIEKTHSNLSFQFTIIHFIILICQFVGCTLVISNPLEITKKTFKIILPVYFILYLISMLLFSQLDHYGDIGTISRFSSSTTSELSITFFHVPKWKPFQEFTTMINSLQSLSYIMKIKLSLLLPYHVAWGFCTTYWIYYTLGVIVREEQGLKYISIAAIIDVTVSLLYTKLSSYCFKSSSNTSNSTISLLIGHFSMITLGLLILITSDSSLGKNKRIIGYLILHGISRSVYENNMKIVLLNLFIEHDAIIYLTFTSSFKVISCGIAYLIYALFIHERIIYAIVIITLSIISLICYFILLYINSYKLFHKSTSNFNQSCNGYYINQHDTLLDNNNNINNNNNNYNNNNNNNSLDKKNNISDIKKNELNLPISNININNLNGKEKERNHSSVYDDLIPRSSTSSITSELMYVAEYF